MMSAGAVQLFVAYYSFLFAKLISLFLLITIVYPKV